MLQAETRELGAEETREQSMCARTHPRTRPIRTSEQRMLARSCFRMAVFLWSEGAIEETQDLYRRGLGLDPSKAEAWNNFAVSLLVRGKTQDAAEAFERALLLNPSSPQVAYNAGVFQLEAGNEPKKAKRLLRRVLKQIPGNAEAQHSMAKVLMHPQIRDYIGCYRMLKRNLAADENDIATLCTYAAFQAEYLCEPEEALSTYRQVLERDPTNLAALAGKAVLLSYTCDTPHATHQVQRLYQHVVSLHPGSAVVRAAYASFEHHIAHAREHAQELYQQALSLDPQSLDALLGTALLFHFHRGDLEEAQQVYEKALAVAPSDADTRSNYGQLLLDRNVAGKGRADAEAVWTRCLVRLVRVVS